MPSVQRAVSVVLRGAHDGDPLGRLDMAHEDVLVLAPVGVLAANVGLHRARDLGDDDIGLGRGQALAAMVLELLEGAGGIGMRHARATRDRRDVDPAEGGVGRRAADRLVALVIPDHDEQVLRLLVAQRGEDAEVEHHAAVGVERDDAAVGKPCRQTEGLRRDTAQLLLEQAGRAHVRGGVVPFVDRGAERQDHQLVRQHRGQFRHAVKAFHRTMLPDSATAVW
ncbi:hypothetical protein SDC9_42877 [bioreactor metagenome]|uniref:Uncharacterized protein n=1 Tax=bioreactor metagenome TaxID=1076179 RepID=A0A644VYZ3_9ZZZZ